MLVCVYLFIITIKGFDNNEFKSAFVFKTYNNHIIDTNYSPTQGLVLVKNKRHD